MRIWSDGQIGVPREHQGRHAGGQRGGRGSAAEVGAVVVRVVALDARAIRGEDAFQAAAAGGDEVQVGPDTGYSRSAGRSPCWPRRQPCTGCSRDTKSPPRIGRRPRPWSSACPSTKNRSSSPDPNHIMGTQFDNWGGPELRQRTGLSGPSSRNSSPSMVRVSVVSEVRHRPPQIPGAGLGHRDVHGQVVVGVVGEVSREVEPDQVGPRAVGQLEARPGVQGDVRPVEDGRPSGVIPLGRVVAVPAGSDLLDADRQLVDPLRTGPRRSGTPRISASRAGSGVSRVPAQFVTQANELDPAGLRGPEHAERIVVRDR